MLGGVPRRFGNYLLLLRANPPPEPHPALAESKLSAIRVVGTPGSPLACTQAMQQLGGHHGRQLGGRRE
jgi:hypothetical protein